MMAVAAVACSTAGAEPAVPGPGAPSAPPAGFAGPRPAGWKQLPAISSAVAAAVRADGVTIDAVDAWGEPARGCYGVWLELHGGTGAAIALADDALASLQRAAGPTGLHRRAAGSGAPAAIGSPGPLVIDEVVKPTTAEGVLAFRFTRSPYRGRVRAQLGRGRVAAIACFGNQREPVDCEARCARVIPGAGDGAPR